MGINLRQIMAVGDDYASNSETYWDRYKRTDQQVISLVSGIAVGVLVDHVGQDDLGAGPTAMWREIESKVMEACKKKGIRITTEDKEWNSND